MTSSVIRKCIYDLSPIFTKKQHIVGTQETIPLTEPLPVGLGVFGDIKPPGLVLVNAQELPQIYLS